MVGGQGSSPEGFSRSIGTVHGTQSGTLVNMPSLNVSFTEEELASIRAAAAGADVSLKSFAHTAILAAASEHRRRVAEAAEFVARRSAELNRRLA